MKKSKYSDLLMSTYSKCTDEMINYVLSVCDCVIYSGSIHTKYNEYVDGSAIKNIIYPFKLNELYSINRFKNSIKGHTISVGWSDVNNWAIGFTHRGYLKFSIGAEVANNSMLMGCSTTSNIIVQPGFIIKNKQCALELAVIGADYLD